MKLHLTYLIALKQSKGLSLALLLPKILITQNSKLDSLRCRPLIRVRLYGLLTSSNPSFGTGISTRSDLIHPPCPPQRDSKISSGCLEYQLVDLKNTRSSAIPGHAPLSDAPPVQCIGAKCFRSRYYCIYFSRSINGDRISALSPWLWLSHIAI